MLTVDRMLRSWESWRTSAAVVTEIDKLLNQHTAKEIAVKLNEQGYRSGKGMVIDATIVNRICREHELKSRHDRLRAAGMIELDEIARRLGVTRQTILIWRREGLLRAHAFNGRDEYLFEPPGPDAPVSGTHKGIHKNKLQSKREEEVQYGA